MSINSTTLKCKYLLCSLALYVLAGNHGDQ